MGEGDARARADDCAFPVLVAANTEAGAFQCLGLTKLELMSALILAGMVGRGPPPMSSDAAARALFSVGYARALLKALNETEHPR